MKNIIKKIAIAIFILVSLKSSAQTNFETKVDTFYGTKRNYTYEDFFLKGKTKKEVSNLIDSLIDKKFEDENAINYNILMDVNKKQVKSSIVFIQNKIRFIILFDKKNICIANYFIKI